MLAPLIIASKKRHAQWFRKWPVFRPVMSGATGFRTVFGDTSVSTHSVLPFFFFFFFFFAHILSHFWQVLPLIEKILAPQKGVTPVSHMCHTFEALESSLSKANLSKMAQNVCEEEEEEEEGKEEERSSCEAKLRPMWLNG